jgi:hypothetical protein
MLSFNEHEVNGCVIYYLSFIGLNFKVFSDDDGNLNNPIVLKYDGLAEGKGVHICNTVDEIKKFVIEVYFEKKYSRIN